MEVPFLFSIPLFSYFEKDLEPVQEIQKKVASPINSDRRIGAGLLDEQFLPRKLFFAPFNLIFTYPLVITFVYCQLSIGLLMVLLLGCCSLCAFFLSEKKSNTNVILVWGLVFYQGRRLVFSRCFEQQLSHSLAIGHALDEAVVQNIERIPNLASPTSKCAKYLNMSMCNPCLQISVASDKSSFILKNEYPSFVLLYSGDSHLLKCGRAFWSVPWFLFSFILGLLVVLEVTYTNRCDVSGFSQFELLKHLALLFSPLLEIWRLFQQSWLLVPSLPSHRKKVYMLSTI